MWTITNTGSFFQVLVQPLQTENKEIDRRRKWPRMSKNAVECVGWLVWHQLGFFLDTKGRKEEGAQWLLLVTMRGDRRNNGEIPPYWFLLYPCIACILRCIPSCIACITCTSPITVSFQYPHHPSVVDLHYEQLLLKPLLEVTWLDQFNLIFFLLFLFTDWYLSCCQFYSARIGERCQKKL